MALQSVSLVSCALFVFAASAMATDAIATPAPVPPASLNFTWDFFPTFVKVDALDTEENLKIAAGNFKMVVVALHNHQATERDALDTVAKLKGINSSIPVIYYLNTEKMLNSTATVKHIIKAHPESLLRADNGSFIHPDKFPGDYTLDYRQSDMADYYLSECLNATTAGAADGCLLDSASNFNEPDEMINEGDRLSIAEQDAYVTGKRSALQRLQQTVPTGKAMFVHCGHCFPPAKTCAGVNGMGSQVFHPTMEWVSNLQALAKEGKALKIYGKSRGKKGCHGEDGAVSRGHIFAAFLVGAGPNMYWNCGPDCNNNYVYPEYTKPLGPPLSDAVFEEQGTGKPPLLVRRFAHGVVAKFRPGKNATDYGHGCVVWGDSTVTGRCPS